jgi:hypothetical protein
MKGTMNEGEVYLGLFGDDFDPDAVTRIIGLKPTRIMRKGNPRPKRSSWEFSTGKIKGEVVDVYEMASSLVKKLAPYENQILNAKNDLDLDAVLEVVLTITCDDSKSTPAIGFEGNVLTFLNKIGATIDIDTYRD